MVCKFCNSSSISIKRDVNSPHNHKSYHLYFCSDCLSHFFDISQFQITLKDLYDDLSTSRGEFPEEFIPSGKWKRQVKIIEKLSERPIKSVLDVGCRTGDFLMHFNPDINRDGVELSDHFAGIANQRGLTIYNEYLEKVNFSDKYDVISSFAILEHLENPMVFLDRLGEIINPSGLLVIMIPTYDCLKRRLLDVFGKHWHMYTPPEHLNYYSRKFLDSYLDSKGFKLVKRYFSSGGMAGGSYKLPLCKKAAGKSAELFDRSFLNRLPVFDHMYNYYLNND